MCHFQSRCWCQASVETSYKESCRFLEMPLPAICLQVHQNLWFKTFILDHRTYLSLPHLPTWVTYLYRWLEDDGSILQQLLQLWSKAKRKIPSNVFAKPELYQNVPSHLNISCELGKRQTIEVRVPSLLKSEYNFLIYKSLMYVPMGISQPHQRKFCLALQG